MRKIMNKKDAIKEFNQEIRPYVEKQYPNDRCALEQAWNDWTDGLCKDRVITMKQYETWDNPF
jgi:hypothetical protein